MKMRMIPVLFLFAIIGCAPKGIPDATVQLTMAGDVLNVSEQLLANAERSHLIPDADASGVKASINSAHSLYATAAAHVNDSTFSAALADANAAIAQVVILRTKFAGGK